MTNFCQVLSTNRSYHISPEAHHACASLSSLPLSLCSLHVLYLLSLSLTAALSRSIPESRRRQASRSSASVPLVAAGTVAAIGPPPLPIDDEWRGLRLSGGGRSTTCGGDCTWQIDDERMRVLPPPIDDERRGMRLERWRWLYVGLLPPSPPNG
jgi:hypothetical protein